MKKEVIKLLGFLSLLFISVSLWAQTDQREISGKVTTENGEPLPDVSVSLKGTNIGTVTNDLGVYTINVPDETQSMLIFTFIGMKTQEITLGESDKVNVVLEANTMSLDEVVTIGYGRVKKKDLTGSVSTVKGETVAKRNITQLSQAIQGTIPGVMVTRTNSEPGAASTIRIRGITTIGNSAPLIIVDGVPVSSINDVNPKDIQDISVLKDAASASIYGSRAASGVILITTKEAKAGEFSLEYDATFGIEKPTQFPKMVGVKRYMEMFNEYTWNDAGNIDGQEYAFYNKDDIDNWRERNKWDPNGYPITDWVDLIIKDYAPRQNHQITLSGGGDRIKSRASINYEKVSGLYDNNSYERISSRLRNKFKVNDFITVDIDLSYNRRHRTEPSLNPVEKSRRFAPVYSAMWDDGRISGGKNGDNLFAQLHYGGSQDEWRDMFQGRAAIDVRPIKGLSVKAVFSPQLYKIKNKDFNKKIPYYDADVPTQLVGYISGHTTTSLSEKRTDGKGIVNQFFINYDKAFSKHDFNIMAGYEDSYNFREAVGANGDNFELSDFPYLDLAPLDFQTASGTAYETAYRSLFGRVMYNYDGKYLLQTNIRRDGSSRFAQDFRWGTFPSLSAGWVLTEEDFLKDNDILSYLKIRASWGQLGNERIGNYPYQTTLQFTNPLFYQGGKIVSDMAAAQVKYAIPNITWEVTDTKDIGFDAYFLNNKLSLTFDYYNKRTKDMLLPLEIPDFTGFANPDQNAGTMRTKGWDLQLSWRDQISEFKYSATFNLSDSRSVMGDLNGKIVQGSNTITKEGSEYQEFYGYLSDGLYQDKDEAISSPSTSSSVQPGDIKYIDVNGSDGTPDGKISPEYDRVLLGGSLPRYIYGGNITAGYKNFDLFIAFQGVGKKKSLIKDAMVRPFMSAWTTPQEIIDGKYWSVYNTDEQNKRAQFPRLSRTSAESNNYETSDFWLINGAYFRLKNITLGYTFPLNYSRKIKINKLRFFVSITDLFSLDHFPKGWDPEVSKSSYISSSYLFGTSLKF